MGRPGVRRLQRIATACNAKLPAKLPANAEKTHPVLPPVHRAGRVDAAERVRAAALVQHRQRADAQRSLQARDGGGSGAGGGVRLGRLVLVEIQHPPGRRVGKAGGLGRVVARPGANQSHRRLPVVHVADGHAPLVSAPVGPAAVAAGGGAAPVVGEGGQAQDAGLVVRLAVRGELLRRAAQVGVEDCQHAQSALRLQVAEAGHGEHSHAWGKMCMQESALAASTRAPRSASAEAQSRIFGTTAHRCHPCAAQKRARLGP